MPVDVPANYVSPDVENRTNGQKPTLGASIADRIRGLIISVRDDYNSTLKGQAPLQTSPNDAYAQGLSDAAVQQIHQHLKAIFPN